MSCALLVVNSLIVSNVLVSLAEILPAIVSQQRWSQAIGFVGPVLLLVVHTFPEAGKGGDEPVGRLISARKATPRERRAYEEGSF